MLEEQYKEMISSAPIFIFMKGDKERPLCRFSAQAVGLLNMYGKDYSSFNILSDDKVRESVKEFSSWPTYPQIYVKGELIGGGDILIELHENGELEKVLS